MDYTVKTDRELEVTADTIDAALSSVRRKCAVFKWIALASFVALSVIGVISFSLLTINIFNNNHGEYDFASLIRMGVQCVLFSAILFFVLRVFTDLEKGTSPFSCKAANRIQIGGILLILMAIVDANLPQIVEFVSSNSGLLSGVVHLDEPVFGVNISSLISGFVFVGFSLILRFGALLQDVSDGTV